jgi:hypothetical protein
MDAIIIELKDKTDARFWLELTKKNGNRARSLNLDDIEDFGLDLLIEKGMKTENVRRESVMKALEK